MERIVALKKLRKILGDKLGYQINPKAPTREERELALARLPAFRLVREQAEKAMVARREVLMQDVEYQRLVVAWKAARKVCEEAHSLAISYKITVGVSSSMFFHVKAQGDSWEDVLAKLKR